MSYARSDFLYHIRNKHFTLKEIQLHTYLLLNWSNFFLALEVLVGSVRLSSRNLEFFFTNCSQKVTDGIVVLKVLLLQSMISKTFVGSVGCNRYQNHFPIGYKCFTVKIYLKFFQFVIIFTKILNSLSWSFIVFLILSFVVQNFFYFKNRMI